MWWFLHYILKMNYFIGCLFIFIPAKNEAISQYLQQQQEANSAEEDKKDM